MEPGALASQAGLADAMADELRAATLRSVEERLADLGGENHEAVLRSIHDMVLADVDKKVQEKADELWKRGQALLTGLQSKHKEKTQRLTEEVSACLERQRALEAENELLKQALQAVVSRFAQLGAIFSGLESAQMGGAAPGAGAAAAAAAAAAFCSANVASASTASTETGSAGGASASSPKELFTPVTGRGADASLSSIAAGAASMPVIPPFPFAAPLTSAEQGATTPVPGSANTLSLGEALGKSSPQPAATSTRTPLSLANSLTSSPRLVSEGGGFRFKFTLRKADGTDLGLNVSHNENEEVLRVDNIRPNGAVDAWNRQCAGAGNFNGRAVMPGDKIISVNNVSRDPQKMLEECKDKQLLKLEIARYEGVIGAPPGIGAAPGLTPGAVAAAETSTPSLRADASVFVPRADASVFVPRASEYVAATKQSPEENGA